MRCEVVNSLSLNITLNLEVLSCSALLPPAEAHAIFNEEDFRIVLRESFSTPLSILARMKTVRSGLSGGVRL